MTAYALPPQCAQAQPGRGLALLESRRSPEGTGYWQVRDFQPLRVRPGARLSMADIEDAVDELRERNSEALCNQDGLLDIALMLGLLRGGQFIIPGRDDPEYDQVIGEK